MFEGIEYEVRAKPNPEELMAFYKRQGCETQNAREKLQRMLRHTSCFVAARRNGDLIGWARGVTDGLWGRLADCKLDPAFQGPACITRTDGRIEHDAEGIAGEMARRVISALRESGAEKIDVLAYGTEVDFCEELGFRKIPGMVLMELPAGVGLQAPELVSSGTSA